MSSRRLIGGLTGAGIHDVLETRIKISAMKTVKSLSTRRDFLGSMAFAAAGGLQSFAVVGGQKSGYPASWGDIRAVYIPWGHNMWGESLPKDIKSITGSFLCNDHLKFNETMWQEIVDRLVLRKMNIVVIDLGEFPVYPSHPELAVKGSRSPDWVLAEVRRLKSLGIEAIPKLNFSTTHDAWLGEYGRMVTTKTYYQVCCDLIRDAAEMFDHPRFLHIGYDEERAEYQKGYQCVRTGEVWWHDFLFFVKTVEDAGMRPWMWSDYGWKHEDFVPRCPKSVIHNNWYYDEWMEGFDTAKMKPGSKSRPMLELFLKLDKAGFDQVPCSSLWLSREREEARAVNDDCMANMVKFCRANLSRGRLGGFLMAPWAGDYDNKDFLKTNIHSIDKIAEALEQGDGYA